MLRTRGFDEVAGSTVCHVKDLLVPLRSVKLGNRNSKSFTARRNGSGGFNLWKNESHVPNHQPEICLFESCRFFFAFHTFVHPFFLILSSKCGQNSRLPLVADLLHILIRDGARIRLRPRMIRTHPDQGDGLSISGQGDPQKNGLCAPG